MAFFLRDQQIKNIFLDADALKEINSVFAERYRQLLDDLKSSGKSVFFTYIIRFDNKGYRVFSIDELLMYFNQARDVARIIYTVESADSLSSSRITGAFLELCLDTKEPARCVLQSTSDTKDWAEASFAAVHEVINKCKTRNGVARSPWANLAVQLFGVVIGFIISLWLAFKVSPNIKVENSFALSFFFIFVIFSNVWTYLNQTLLGLIAKLFPNIEFIRPKKSRINWLMQAVVGSAAFAVVIYALGLASSFLTKFIVGFISVSP